MKTVIKFMGRKINVSPENPTDLQGASLRFGDKILVVGPKREILHTYFVGESVSGESIMYLSKYTGYLSSCHRSYVIKYHWKVGQKDSHKIKSLQEINKQINEELGIDLYA